MTQGAWCRWGSPPTLAEMAEAISDQQRPGWLALTEWLRDTYGLDGELTWTDDESGWVLRYRRSGRALTTLMPEADDGFRALVVVGPSIVDAALAASLGPSTHDALESAKAYADGRWLWLRVTEPATVDDVRTLIALKSPPPVRRRAKAAVTAAGEPSPTSAH